MEKLIEIFSKSVPSNHTPMPLLLLFLPGVWGVLLAAVGATSPPGSVVYSAGTDGYHTFRIPSLAATRSGVLLAAAEGRARYGFVPPHGDVNDCFGVGASARDWMCTDKDVVLTRSLDGGATWSAASALALANDTVFYTNPQLLTPRAAGAASALLLFMRCRVPLGGGNSFVNCTAVVASSHDDGESWEGFVDIPPEQSSTGGFGGIELRTGRLLFSPPGAKSTGALFSDDGGSMWTWGAPLPYQGENEVVELGGGDLLVTMRRLNNTRALARSTDGGTSWGPPKLQAVTDPNCQASMVAIHSAAGGARPLLFANPHTSGLLPYAEGRQNVTVQFSHDDGVSWAPLLLVDAGPSAYTSLAQLGNAAAGAGSCGVLYEESADLPVDFRSIRFVAFDCASGAA